MTSSATPGRTIDPAAITYQLLDGYPGRDMITVDWSRVPPAVNTNTNAAFFTALGASPLLTVGALEGYDSYGVRLRADIWFTPDCQTAYVAARYRDFSGSTPGPRCPAVYYRCTIPALRELLAEFGIYELDHNLARFGLEASDVPPVWDAPVDFEHPQFRFGEHFRDNNDWLDRTQQYGGQSAEWETPWMPEGTDPWRVFEFRLCPRLGTAFVICDTVTHVGDGEDRDSVIASGGWHLPIPVLRQLLADHNITTVHGVPEAPRAGEQLVVVDRLVDELLAEVEPEPYEQRPVGLFWTSDDQAGLVILPPLPTGRQLVEYLLEQGASPERLLKLRQQEAPHGWRIHLTVMFSADGQHVYVGVQHRQATSSRQLGRGQQLRLTLDRYHRLLETAGISSPDH